MSREQSTRTILIEGMGISSDVLTNERKIWVGNARSTEGI